MRDLVDSLKPVVALVLGRLLAGLTLRLSRLYFWCAQNDPNDARAGDFRRTGREFRDLYRQFVTDVIEPAREQPTNIFLRSMWRA